MNIKTTLILVAALIIFVGILIIEGFIASLGPKEQFTNPKRVPQTFGENKNKLRYLVMGDSTGAGQGGDYEQGITILTAKHLAQNYQVDLLNTSVSGARVKDVISDQLEEGLKFNPDIILISVGANDVVKMTNIFSLKKQLHQLISRILEANCNIKIVLTASPDMGTVPRFAQPLRFIAGLHTGNVNNIFNEIISKHNLTLAPIAKETGPIFKKDTTLFASDNFHPNNRGYAEWVKVLTPSLDKALKESSYACSEKSPE